MATSRTYSYGHRRRYQLAIALNNTAVSLIQKHRYHDAVDALRASIAEILNLSSLHGELYREMQIETQQTDSSKSSWCALAQASKRLACPQTAEELNSYMLSPDLYILTSNYYYNPAFLTSSNLFSDSTEFAMRIDDHEEVPYGARINADLDAATIFFNYGTACRCCLDFSGCSSDEEDYLLNSSLQLLKLSRQLLMNGLEKINWQQTPTITLPNDDHYSLQGLDWKLSARILFQSMLTARSLWCCTLSLRVEDECEIYYRETVRQSQSFLHFLRLLRFQEYTKNTSAPAA